MRSRAARCVMKFLLHMNLRISGRDWKLKISILCFLLYFFEKGFFVMFFFLALEYLMKKLRETGMLSCARIVSPKYHKNLHWNHLNDSPASIHLSPTLNQYIFCCENFPKRCWKFPSNSLRPNLHHRYEEQWGKNQFFSIIFHLKMKIVWVASLFSLFRLHVLFSLNIKRAYSILCPILSHKKWPKWRHLDTFPSAE